MTATRWPRQSSDRPFGMLSWPALEGSAVHREGARQETAHARALISASAFPRIHLAVHRRRSGEVRAPSAKVAPDTSREAIATKVVSLSPARRMVVLLTLLLAEPIAEPDPDDAAGGAEHY